MKRKKPKIAIISLTADEGCQFPILDLGEKFLALTRELEVADFRLIEEEGEKEHYDICFIEGCMITRENKKKLLRARAKSDYVVALGTCATQGSIPEMKNYSDKLANLKRVYRNGSEVDNPEIRPIREYVKVDFEIPGCPINAFEFLRVCYYLIDDLEPRIPLRPVCYECQRDGNACLLREGEICLGPASLGGCEAVCPASRYPCQGCRGLVPGANVNNLRKLILKDHFEEDLDLVLQKFGLKDEWDKRFALDIHLTPNT